MPSTFAPLRRVPLSFRLLLALVATALVVACVLTLEVGGRQRIERAEAAELRLHTAAKLAARAAPHLAVGDSLRLAVVGAAAVDLLGADARVLLLDADGTVQFDSGAVLGGERLGLEPTAPGEVRRLADGSAEVAAPCRLNDAVVGEARVRIPALPPLAAFSWSLFALFFLASLSLICLAVALCHHWLTRVTDAVGVARRLAVGEHQARCPLGYPGVLGELGDALAGVGFALEQEHAGSRASIAELALALVDQLERRDQTPPGHGERTARYARILVERLELLPADAGDIELAARVHDVGKVVIRPALLTKRGPLDEDERRSLRQHSDRGASFFAAVPSMQRIAQIVRSHHEKYDGTGYPDGLRGDRIPLGARILAIADAYDVLTSNTGERQGLGWSQALERLGEARGTHFDPWLLDLFAESIASSPMPDAPVRNVMISMAGVVPFEVAEPGDNEEELSVDESWSALLEAELELLREEQEEQGVRDS